MRIGAAALALLTVVAAGCSYTEGRRAQASQAQKQAPAQAPAERWAVPAPPLSGPPYAAEQAVWWPYPGIDTMLTHRRELGLSAQQVGALSKLRIDAATRSLHLNAQREQLCMKLDEALAADKVDLILVKGLIDGIAEAEAGIYYGGIEATVEAEEHLSPEQLARLDQIAAPSWQVVPPGPVPPPGAAPRPPAPVPPLAPPEARPMLPPAPPAPQAAPPSPPGA